MAHRSSGGGHCSTHSPIPGSQPQCPNHKPGQRTSHGQLVKIVRGNVVGDGRQFYTSTSNQIHPFEFEYINLCLNFLLHYSRFTFLATAVTVRLYFHHQKMKFEVSLAQYYMQYNYTCI